MAKDFYQVLGLKRDADEKAIKGAYRAPSDGAVEGEVVEGEVTDKK